MISGGVTIAALIRASSCSPVRGVISKPIFLASSRNCGSSSVRVEGAAHRLDAVGRHVRRQHDRAAELDAGREEVEDLPLLVGLDELVDGRRVEPAHRVVLEREQRARGARLEPVRPRLRNDCTVWQSPSSSPRSMASTASCGLA